MGKVTVSLVVFLMVVLVGCSGFDTTQVLVHPDEVGQSATFDVALVNVYTLPDTAIKFTNKIVRDSLHVLIGLPADWSVVGASMSVVSTMSLTELMDLQANKTSEVDLAAKLLEIQNKATLIPADELLSEQIKNKKITAHDQKGDAPNREATLASADIWKGFSAPVNLTFEKGAEPDTVMPIDSAAKLAVTLGMIDSASAKVIYGTQKTWPVPDTIGLSMIPVMVFLKVRAPSNVADDTLYYFTKSGKMNTATSPFVSLIGIKDTALSRKVASMEYGEMCYVPIRMVPHSGVKHEIRQSGSHVTPQVFRLSGGSVRIHAGLPVGTLGRARIFSTSGLLIAEIAGSKEMVYQWDGVDNSNRPVAAGTYIFTITDKKTGNRAIPVMLAK